MSMVLRIAFAAAVTTVLASNALAQGPKAYVKVKPFTVAEKSMFDRASASSGGGYGGGGDGGGSS